ncbi:MAG: hypothetical protein ABS882_08935 [Lysinibacillus sp.]
MQDAIKHLKKAPPAIGGASFSLHITTVLTANQDIQESEAAEQNAPEKGRKECRECR